jgi:PTH1 family peptidyl-tRNA hydrolase
VSKFLIVGIGNPGPEHAGQRHNAGFWVVDHLAERHGIKFRTTPNAWVGEGRISDEDVILMKPRTYVNRSGQAAGPVARREAIEPDHVIVAYDELDLPEGRIRLRAKGSSGGHNGLKSISQALGSDEFGRIRVGIGRPYHQGVPSWDPEVVIRHVLANPGGEGKRAVEDAVDRASDAIEAVIRDGWYKAMDRYNGKAGG